MPLLKLRPVGEVEVLQVVVLLFLAKPIQSCLDVKHLLFVDQVGMDVLHAHPLVIAPGVDIQRKPSINSDIYRHPFFLKLELLLLRFNANTCQHKTVVNLHEIHPLVVKRCRHAIEKLAD